MEAPPVQYVTTADECRIAYCVRGTGIPWLMVPAAFHHLYLSLRRPIYRHWVEGLASRFMVVDYDGRGMGLSTRGMQGFSWDDPVVDMEAIVDHLDLEPAVVFGVASGFVPAVRFALKRPERVRALVLMACSVTTQPWPAALFRDLAGSDWDTFVNTFGGMGNNPEESAQARELLKASMTQADFVAQVQAFQGISVEQELRQISAPALVIYPGSTGSARPGGLERHAEVASLLANSRLVEVPSHGLGMVAAWGDFDLALPHIEDFLGVSPRPHSMATRELLDVPLSDRQRDVLRLVAEGKTNREIAQALYLSLRTVERHLTDIYARLGVRNRSEAVSRVLAQQSSP